MPWETVIGLEVHVQLNTQSKIFSGASTDFGAPPNTQACMIDLAFPGTLPAPNGAPIEKAVRFALSIGADTPPYSVFARKHYFYPDLPKGYQISQYKHPIVGKGELLISLTDDSEKTIGIHHAHLEEDAGKSLHEGLGGGSGIDLNRAGVPLLEIVSEPDMRSAQEAVVYLKTLHALVCYIDICDGNMQEGSFRCDANVSVRPLGCQALGTRTEIKNINSFKFVEKAILHERDRQIDLLMQGVPIVQQTRLYDSEKNETRPMRSKEEAMDYRYFEDPDLPPVPISKAMIQAVAKTMPELPRVKKQRFITQYALPRSHAHLLSSDLPLTTYFEASLAALPKVDKTHVKLAANWIIGDLLGALHKRRVTIDQSPVLPKHMAGLIQRLVDGTLSGKTAKLLFEALLQQQGEVDALIAQKGLAQVTDTQAIEKQVDAVLAAHPKQVAAYRAGKVALLGFFVGQVMKATKGKANPKVVNDLIQKRLGCKVLTHE